MGTLHRGRWFAAATLVSGSLAAAPAVAGDGKPEIVVVNNGEHGINPLGAALVIHHTAAGNNTTAMGFSTAPPCMDSVLVDNNAPPPPSPPPPP